jgi:uncharacterized membrane protein YfcA
MNDADLILAGIAAIAAGLVNALAGGGTLITFPVLTFLGIPPVAANVTNTVALCPGYLGGSIAQRKDLTDQKKRIYLLVPLAIAGGVGGGFLLLVSGEKIFSNLVPWLILFASLLLAIQDPVRRMIFQRIDRLTGKKNNLPAALVVAPAAIYGGYFGAGLGVIIISVLGLLLDDNLVRLNALKQLLSLCINVAAAVFFLFSGQVYWVYAGVMAVCALLGGTLGGRLAGKLKPEILKWLIVVIGLTAAVLFFLKT